MKISTNTNPTDPTKIEPLFKALVAMYLVLLSLSLLVLKVYEIRPYIYYILVAAIAVIVFLQIMAFPPDRRKSMFILLQIMLLGVSVIWSMTLKYFYYIGRTDVMGHTWLAQNLLQTAHVSAIFDVYQAFPLWHILTVTLYALSGMPVDLNQIMYLACGLIFLVLPVGVYLVSFKLCRSQKIALLSALIISLNSDILIIGMYSIARSVASFFLVVLLLIFLSDRTTNKKETTKMLALALCLTLAIIVFHTVSILFILSMLLVVYVLQKFLVRGGGSPIVSGKYLLASIAITAAYWLIFARNLVDLVVSDLTASETMTMALPTAASGASTSELFNYLQYMPLLLFVIVGILIVLRSQRFGKEMKLFGIATLLFIPLAFPGPLLLIGKLNENFDLSRFNEYTFLFMGILAAVGLAVLYQRNSRLLKALCIVVFAAWILFSVSNDFVASDNPLVKRTFYTSYMTEGEITGMDSILGITQASAGYMLSDYVSGRYVQFSSLGPDYPFQPTVAEAYAPDNLLLKSNSSDVILIRENELAKRPMKLVNLTTPQYNYAPHESQIVYFDMDDGVFDNLGEMNQIYNSSAVVGYN